MKAEEEKQNIRKKESEDLKKTRIVSTRGRVFKGVVIAKFSRRITIEFERTVYIPKYERFLKKSTKIHARIPQEARVEIGDLVQVQECRPLSKLIHTIFIKKIKSTGRRGK